MLAITCVLVWSSIMEIKMIVKLIKHYLLVAWNRKVAARYQVVSGF
uniref:Uncharacterized protein n=2 Tax=Anguilla anguilla TaxID=7936 RepID=A0A0E9PYX5_ANGAN